MGIYIYIYIYIFVDALNLFCVIPHPLDGDFPRAYSDQELLAPHRNQGGVVIRLHVGTRGNVMSAASRREYPDVILCM